MSRSEVMGQLGRALLTGDRETARRLYFKHVIPSDEFSHREAYALAYRLGAIDEGDRHLAARTDL